ncbi:hypothetical protein [Pedobacter nyackensis]|uniref:Uncharacterized protein n=1 Tax=Pedobacter nyackensis TaxID=475255 RepID=A0A1W2AJ39_9SPHI|nr:hypothetical protein [Pedobacter nyackensis]SMC60653.1 hypothetical protein SAMN04488101_101654 [Pedobacter nyackensis]
MLYFKTVPFPGDVKQPEVEKALRKYALKKTSSLDFKSSTMNVGTDKIFFGLEDKTSLKFTRIKTSFEFMLPKLIISLPKDQMATAYKIRLSAIPFAVCLFISFCIFTVILGLLNGKTDAEATIFILVLAILFFSLLKLELKLSQLRVLKSIKKDKDQ